MMSFRSFRPLPAVAARNLREALCGERDGHLAGNCFAVLQAIGNHSQRERLGGNQGLLAGPSVAWRSLTVAVQKPRGLDRNSG